MKITSLAPNVTAFELEPILGTVSVQSVRALGWQGGLVDRFELARSLERKSARKPAAELSGRAEAIRR